MLAVPAEGPAEALAQLRAGLPADFGADLGRVEVLALDLPARVPGAAIVGLDLPWSELADQIHHFANGMRPSPARVERLAATAAAGKRLGDRQIRRGSVLGVEEVTLGRAIGANHRSAPVEHG